MKKYLLVSYILLLFNIMYLLSSMGSSLKADNYTVESPKVIPPTPETASLFRYLENSLDHSRGALTIDIPVYEIQYGNLRLPITLNYDGSGRHTSDMTGAIGIGWSLGTGGAISCMIKGKPDWVCPVDSGRVKKLIDYKTKDKPLVYSELIKELYSENSNYDTEYDIFNYSIAGFSGSFILSNFDILKMDNNPISIYRRNTDFVIVDDKGIQYKFIATEHTHMSKYGIQPVGWYLANITSADGIYSISFKLKSGKANIKAISPVETLEIVDQIEDPRISGAYNTMMTPVVSRSNIEYERKIIEEIQFGDKSLFFESNDSNIVKKIVVKDNSSVVKQLSLKHSVLDQLYFDGFLQINYKLDEVIWQDSKGKDIEKYRLEYNPSSSFFGSNIDWWGFRNGSNSQSVFPPMNIKRISFNTGTTSTINTIIGNSNRKPSYQECLKGSLKKIIYPTGGFSEFEYEPNLYSRIGYSQPTVDKEGGGIRLKKIVTSDQNLNQITKTYDYDSGIIKYDPNRLVDNMSESFSINYEDKSSQSFVVSYAFRRRIFSSEFGSELSYFGNLPVFYESVTEYTNISKDQKFKTKYTYTNKDANTSTSEWPIPSYPNQGDSSPYFKGLRYYPFSHGTNQKSYGSYYDYFWKQNYLVSQEDFGVNELGEYKLIKRTSYNYNYTPEAYFHCAILTLNVELPYASYETQSLEYAWQNILLDSYGKFPLFIHPSYILVKGKTELKSVSEITYQDGGNITSSKNYTYNEQSLPAKIEITNSGGRTFTETMLYPIDFKSISPYKEMVTQNILSSVIKQTKKNSLEELVSIEKVYRQEGSMFLLDKVASGKNNALETRLIYHNYDLFGNPLYISKGDADKIVYLWSYSGQYPIAEIKNASYADVLAVVKTVFGVSDIDALSKLVVPNEKTLKGDNLQKALPNALITTYTYKPLVGMTSMTDPRGVVTTYEYDSFGRLSKVKDANGKVINTYDYHYQRPLLLTPIINP